MDMIVRDLKAYHKSVPIESVVRNAHMNEYREETLTQKGVDALLVDFVNFIGMRRGMDLGLYTRDLREELTQNGVTDGN